MTEKKRAKYHTKTVRFGNKELTMYSLDGATWSTRKDELDTIAERHEQERLKSMQSMGEALAEPVEEDGEDSDTAAKGKKVAEDDDEPVRISAEEVDIDGDEDLDDEMEAEPEDDEAEQSEDDRPKKFVKGKAAKAKPVAKKAAPPKKSTKVKVKVKKKGK